MHIKMIVTDLDNTLLRRDKTISAYTESVFRRCRDMGLKIVFATARPIRAVKWLDLPIVSDACVYHNGAVMQLGGQLLHQNGIGQHTVRKLLSEAKQLDGLRIAVEIDDTLYANYDAATVWRGIQFIKTDFDTLPSQPADKIIFTTTDKTEIANLESLLDDDLYCEISEDTLLMVMNKNARKSNAVGILAAHYGIALSEVAAFGDDHNDIEMLRECGFGVAVANAIEEAKAVADDICGDCDNDGVAKWIEERVL